MPTRFYLGNASSAVSPVFSSSWGNSSSADRARMVAVKEGSQIAERSVSGSHSSGVRSYLVRQYVSDPIAAQTISGTVKGVVATRGVGASGTILSQIGIRVVSNDGLTVRGTALALGAGVGTTWIVGPEPYVNRKFHAGAGTALTSVVASANDRIVVEVGGRMSAAGTWTAGLQLGDPKLVSSPATVVDDAAVGTLTWTLLDRVGHLDSSAAYADYVGASSTTHYLKTTGYGFAVPATATITGITVDIVKRQYSGSAGRVQDSRVRLIKAGTIGTTDRADTTSGWPDVFGSSRYGSPADMWGDTWTPDNVNNAGFGVAISAVNQGGAMEIDNVHITIHYTDTGPDVAITRDAGDNETDEWEGVPWVEFSGTISGITAPELTEPPPAVLATPGPAARPVVPWAIDLGDNLGKKLVSLTTLAEDVSVSYEMNRPAIAQMRLPSDNLVLGKLHTDGFPYLYPRARTIKMWRSDTDTPALAATGGGNLVLEDGSGYIQLEDGSGVIALEGTAAVDAISGPKVIRFAGRIETLQDSANGDAAATTITALDPLFALDRRFCRAANATADSVTFSNTGGASIAKILVERTNLLGASSMTTDGGVFDATSARSVTWQWKKVAEAIVELADAAGGFELYVRPLDVETGVLGQLNAYARRGFERTDIVFAWGTEPHNCSAASRIVDGAQLANVVVSIGSQETTNEFVDEASITPHGRLEVLAPHTDVTDRTLLDALTARELELKAAAKETYAVTPIPGVAPEPFTNFDLGDTVTAAAGSALRGGFDVQMRVWAFTIGLVDGNERLASLTLVRNA